jgi:hypothetical protein
MKQFLPEFTAKTFCPKTFWPKRFVWKHFVRKLIFQEIGTWTCRWPCSRGAWGRRAACRCSCARTAAEGSCNWTSRLERSNKSCRFLFEKIFFGQLLFWNGHKKSCRAHRFLVEQNVFLDIFYSGFFSENVYGTTILHSSKKAVSSICTVVVQSPPRLYYCCLFGKINLGSIWNLRWI